MPSTSEQHTPPTSDPKPRLRLIPLDDTVVFPNMGITLTVDVGDDERVVLVPRHENEFLDVGTIAEVSDPERSTANGNRARHRPYRNGGHDRVGFRVDDPNLIGADEPSHAA